MAINVDSIKAYQVQKNNVQQLRNNNNNNYMSFKGDVKDSFEKEEAPAMVEEDEDVVETTADEEDKQEESHTGRNWAIAGGVVALASAITLGILHHRGSDILEKAGNKEAGFWEKVKAGFHGKAPETNKTPETKNTSEAPKADESKAPETPQQTEVVKPDPKIEADLKTMESLFGIEYDKATRKAGLTAVKKRIEANAAKEELARLEKEENELKDLVAKTEDQTEKSKVQKKLDDATKKVAKFKEKTNIEELEKAANEAEASFANMMTQKGYDGLQSIIEAMKKDAGKLQKRIEGMNLDKAKAELDAATQAKNKAIDNLNAKIESYSKEDAFKTAITNELSKTEPKYANLSDDVQKAIGDETKFNEIVGLNKVVKTMTENEKLADIQHKAYELMSKPEDFDKAVSVFESAVNNMSGVKAPFGEYNKAKTAAEQAAQKVVSARNTAISTLKEDQQLIINIAERNAKGENPVAVMSKEEVDKALAAATKELNAAEERCTKAETDATTAEKNLAEKIKALGIDDTTKETIIKSESYEKLTEDVKTKISNSKENYDEIVRLNIELNNANTAKETAAAELKTAQEGKAKANEVVVFNSPDFKDKLREVINIINSDTNVMNARAKRKAANVTLEQTKANYEKAKEEAMKTLSPENQVTHRAIEISNDKKALAQQNAEIAVLENMSSKLASKFGKAEAKA